MNYGLVILSFFFFASCQEAKHEMLWSNKQEIVDYDKFAFQITSDKLDAVKACYIYTALQPVELELSETNDMIVASIPNDKLLHSGPARLVIQDKNDNSTIFLFTGTQKMTIEIKDFRSPKTLITDSSMTQQQLVYTVGNSRNLILTERELAIERWKKLPTRKGTFQAQEEKAETSFYVEAGSTKQIQLMKDGLSRNQTMQFKTKILKDKFGNIIADGTRGIFYLIKGNEQIRIEKTSNKGVVKLEVPKHIVPPYTIKLEIGVIQSNRMIIN